MKIRTGFVSNSSSSSFIVAIPKIKEHWCTRDISDLLDHEKTKDTTKHLWQNIESYLVLKELEKRVRLENIWDFENAALRQQNVEKYEEDLAENFSDLVYDKVMEDKTLNFATTRPPYNTPEYEEWQNRFDAETLRRGQLKLQEFKAKYNNHWIIKLYFSDDSMVGSHMEHEEVFHALPHIRFSHH